MHYCCPLFPAVIGNNLHRYLVRGTLTMPNTFDGALSLMQMMMMIYCNRYYQLLPRWNVYHCFVNIVLFVWFLSCEQLEWLPTVIE